MLKKAFTLALVIAAASAFTSMASASWKHNQVPIQQDVTVELTGNAKVVSGVLGSFECQVTLTALFTAGTTVGHVQSYGPDPVNGGTTPNRCQSGGALAACQIHTWTPTELPWTIHTGYITYEVKEDKDGAITHLPKTEPEEKSPLHPNWLNITTKQTHITTTGGFCPITAATTTPATVLAVPDNPTAVSSVALSGTLTSHTTVGTFSLAFSGTLNVQPPLAGTFEV